MGGLDNENDLQGNSFNHLNFCSLPNYRKFVWTVILDSMLLSDSVSAIET